MITDSSADVAQMVSQTQKMQVVDTSLDSILSSLKTTASSLAQSQANMGPGMHYLCIIRTLLYTNMLFKRISIL